MSHTYTKPMLKRRRKIIGTLTQWNREIYVALECGHHHLFKHRPNGRMYREGILCCSNKEKK